MINVALLISLIVQVSSVSYSCKYEPCRWNLIRQFDLTQPPIVVDTSNISTEWIWPEVGGAWAVSYKASYPRAVVEGTIRFINSTTKKEALVVWGSLRNWTSNAVPVYAPAWNISFNGDLFGFQPTFNGMYLIHIFTRNKRHNPFSSQYVEEPCSLVASDRSLVEKWWISKTDDSDCPALRYTSMWSSKMGTWLVEYRYSKAGVTNSTVFYSKQSYPKKKVITWQIDEAKKSVSYSIFVETQALRGESSWMFNLGSGQSWGFITSENRGGIPWAFRDYSRKLTFRPLEAMDTAVYKFNLV